MAAGVQAFFAEETGSGSLEYVMVAGMVALAGAAVLANAGNFFSTLFQNLTQTATAAWPS